MLGRIFKHLAERKQVAEAAKKAAEETRKQEQEQFYAELISPQYDVIQEVYGKPISPSLRALYANATEIRRSYVEKIIEGRPEDQWIFISCYWPLNMKHVKEQLQQDGIHFAFAGDGSGGQWVVDPTDDHGIISYHEHETGELKSTGVPMVEFLLLKENIENT
jgi:hypothetical protein